MTIHLGPLEEQSLWYQYKTDVWQEGSQQAATVHNIMRTIRAFRNFAELAYVSVPIASGRVKYQLQREKSFVSDEHLMQTVIHDNYHAGWRFVCELIQRRNCPILFPADLTPVRQEWEKAHFQALWLSIIAEMCTELHMSEGWEFSGGCCEELTHVFQLRLGIPKHGDLIFFNTRETEEVERRRMRSIRIYDHRGNDLSLGDGIAAMQRALSWIRSKRFESPKIERCITLLHQTSELSEQRFYQ